MAKRKGKKPNSAKRKGKKPTFGTTKIKPPNPNPKGSMAKKKGKKPNLGTSEIKPPNPNPKGILVTANNPKKTTKPPPVSFTSVNIRHHHVILGENPPDTEGPPLELGWNHTSEESITVDDYETARTSKRRTNFRLIPAQRRHILRRAGFTNDAMKETQSRCADIRRQRKETNKSSDDAEKQRPRGKWERNITRAPRGRRKSRWRRQHILLYFSKHWNKSSTTFGPRSPPVPAPITSPPLLLPPPTSPATGATSHATDTGPAPAPITSPPLLLPPPTAPSTGATSRPTGTGPAPAPAVTTPTPGAPAPVPLRLAPTAEATAVTVAPASPSPPAPTYPPLCRITLEEEQLKDVCTMVALACNKSSSVRWRLNRINRCVKDSLRRAGITSFRLRGLDINNIPSSPRASILQAANLREDDDGSYSCASAFPALTAPPTTPDQVLAPDKRSHESSQASPRAGAPATESHATESPSRTPVHAQATATNHHTPSSRPSHDSPPASPNSMDSNETESPAEVPRESNTIHASPAPVPPTPTPFQQPRESSSPEWPSDASADTPPHSPPAPSDSPPATAQDSHAPISSPPQSPPAPLDSPATAQVPQAPISPNEPRLDQASTARVPTSSEAPAMAQVPTSQGAPAMERDPQGKGKKRKTKNGQWKSSDNQEQVRREAVQARVVESDAILFNGSLQLGQLVYVALGKGSQSWYLADVVEGSQPPMGPIEDGFVRVQVHDDGPKTYRELPEAVMEKVTYERSRRRHAKTTPSASESDPPMKTLLAEHVVPPADGERIPKLYFAEHLEKAVASKLKALEDGTFLMRARDQCEVRVKRKWIENYFPRAKGKEVIEVLAQNLGEWIHAPHGSRGTVNDTNHVSLPEELKGKKQEHVTLDSEYACKHGSLANAVAAFVSRMDPHNPHKKQLEELSSKIMDLGKLRFGPNSTGRFIRAAQQLLNKHGLNLERRKSNFDPSAEENRKIPAIASLMGQEEGGKRKCAVGHWVGLFDGFVHESTWEHSWKWDKATMDEVVAPLELKYAGLAQVYVVVPSKHPPKRLLAATDKAKEGMSAPNQGGKQSGKRKMSANDSSLPAQSGGGKSCSQPKKLCKCNS